jgi:hypothetical protein
MEDRPRLTGPLWQSQRLTLDHNPRPPPAALNLQTDLAVQAMDSFHAKELSGPPG